MQSDDFTVRGGAADAGIWQKLVFAEQMANEYRMPLIRLVDGTGGGGSVKMLEQDPRTYIPQTPAWEWVVANMASVPVVALALGPCAGLGRGARGGEPLQRDGAGLEPGVRRRAAGREGDRRGCRQGRTRRLAEINGQNGVVDDIVDSEAEAFAAARRFLSYLPASMHELPPRVRERRSGGSPRCRP